MSIVKGVWMLPLIACTQALHDGVARTPPMGFNTWNKFHCDIDESMVREVANAMVDTGLKDAGYTYVNIDDCWMKKERDPVSGRQVVDDKRFPSGMKALGDYIHSLGLKFGLYSDAGTATCAGFAGSYGHEDIDAQTFAEYGVDYLKYDNCNPPPGQEDPIPRYEAMSRALARTSRDIVFSICVWGTSSPWHWGPRLGHTWRTSADIVDTWDRMMHNVDNVIGLSRFAGPGGWNDPDMLEVGNGGMTETQYRTHFNLWAIFKAPLLIGCDVRNMTPSTRDVLLQTAVINVNQDVLGVAGDLVHKEGPKEIYAAPLADGSRAVLLLNRQYYPETSEPVSLDFRSVGFMDDTAAYVRDLNGQKELGLFTGSFTLALKGFESRMIRITPAHPAERDTRWRPWLQGHTPADGTESVRLGQEIGDWASAAHHAALQVVRHPPRALLNT